MTKEVADFIRLVIEQQGEEAEICSDYSGRGMFGKKTYAVIVPNLRIFLYWILLYVQYKEKRGEKVSIPDVSIFQTDSMGLDTVIY